MLLLFWSCHSRISQLQFLFCFALQVKTLRHFLSGSFVCSMQLLLLLFSNYQMQSSESVLISMAFPSLFFRHCSTIPHLSLFDDWNVAALHFQIWHLKYAKFAGNSKWLLIAQMSCNCTVNRVFSSSFWDLGFHLISNFLPVAIVCLPIKKKYKFVGGSKARWKTALYRYLLTSA